MILSKQIMNKRERTCLGWTEELVLSHLGISRSMQQGKKARSTERQKAAKWRWRIWCRDKCRALEKFRGKGAGQTIFSWEICLILHSKTFRIWSICVTAHGICPTDFLYASHKSLFRLWSTQELYPFLLHHPFPSCPPPHPVYWLVLQLPHTPILSTEGFVSGLNEDLWSSLSSPENQLILLISLVASFLLTC